LHPHNRADVKLKPRAQSKSLEFGLSGGKIFHAGLTLTQMQLFIWSNICAFFTTDQVKPRHFSDDGKPFQGCISQGAVEMFAGVRGCEGRKATGRASWSILLQNVTNPLWKYQCKETLGFMKESIG